MTVQVDLPVPASALAFGAHPDDIEFGCGATLAKWAAAGASIHLAVLTDGSKGTWDADADLRVLVARREEEQRDAAGILGVEAVHLLGVVDGELRNDAATRERVCALVRHVRPDVLLGHDPWTTGRLHPDHQAAGRLAVEGGIVAARDHHFFPESGAPHRARALLLFEPAVIDHVERVDGFVEVKVAALLAHRTQWRSTMRITDDDDETQRERFADRVRSAARLAGLRVGARAGETFRALHRT